MELKKSILPGVRAAFNLFEDLSPTVDYQTIQINPVDPDTGEAPPPSTLIKRVKVIFDTYSFDRINTGQVREGDFKVILVGDDLGFEPSIDDTIIRGTKTFKIFLVETDPIKLVYELGAREI